MDSTLLALGEADFQWTTHIDTIWRDHDADIPELQEAARAQISRRLSLLEVSETAGSPLGVPLLGTGGSGKTHLLSAIRREAFERDFYFVLVDMTDVREFWETVLLGYLRSLDQQYDGVSQLHRLLYRVVSTLGPKVPTVEDLARSRPPRLINQCNEVLQALSMRNRADTRQHADVVRALILLSSDDQEIQDRGYQWLQGLGIGEDEAFRHGFLAMQRQPEHIVRGLSWLMSLDTPTVLALDQLDAIVAEHNLAGGTETDAEPTPRMRTSLAIIQSIAGGLSALRDVTRRTLTIVSSLEATWSILDRRAPVTMKDRYEPPLLLQPIRDSGAIRRLVEKRLERAYGLYQVTPPYPSFPFPEHFFEQRIGLLPREVLKVCNEHRYACVASGQVIEFPAAGMTVAAPLPGEDVERSFDELVATANVNTFLEREDEDALDELIEIAAEALIEENPLPDHLDAQVDKDFVGSGSFEPLHARLRVVDRNANDRERHYAFRFLEKKHHIAFQSRLKAAMTCAGIDREIEFRKLAVFRTRPIPGGPLSERLAAELRARGGQLIQPAENELKVLFAVRALLSPNDQRAARARAWLRERRPVSTLPMFSDVVSFLFGPAAPGASARPVPTAAPSPPPPAVSAPTSVAVAPAKPAAPAPVGAASAPTTELPLGHKLVGGMASGPFALPIPNLVKHTVVLAGAGSGKTVLLRRIVEEAALAGIPSIVVDGANDLSRLGDAWPEPPPEFTEEDREKAARYAQQSEVVVWSPGRERGNPLRLEPIPDFAAVSGDEDELNMALDMARSSLEPITIGPRVDKVRQGVLGSALRYFARQGGGTLERLIALLSELPAEANGGYEKAEKLARDAADRLRAEMETNPLFRGSGKGLDPAMLLRSKRPERTRVSVINLSGLPDQGAQQQFMNQLSMTLFSWIKKNPARNGALQGLLVIDEARDFVPSGRSVPGKDNVIRLVAQARKYGLGIIFATQAPKSIDHNVIANCSTQFFGKQSSPAGIDTVKEQLVQRGASGGDVAKLPRGVFYAFTDGLGAAVKIQTPLCLSHHPSNPPDEGEVLQRAERSRSLV